MILKRKVLFTSGIVIIFIVFSMCYSSIRNPKVVLTNGSVALSTAKIEWGIKRNENHEQPDLGTKNRTLIEKYNGMALGNNNEKVVYLTFDNGYEAGYTASILDTLKENNVTATFFLTAHYINTASELVQRMIDEGNIIGNHTVNHKSMPSLSQEKLTKEIMNLHTAVYEKFNYEMKYLRPPKGEYSEASLEIITRLGYIPVMWSFGYADWDEKAQPTKEYAINKIVNNVHNGEIMLLHGTSKTNMEVLDTVIKQIKQMGYEFKSLDEFIQ